MGILVMDVSVGLVVVLLLLLLITTVSLSCWHQPAPIRHDTHGEHLEYKNPQFTAMLSWCQMSPDTPSRR